MKKLYRINTEGGVYWKGFPQEQIICLYFSGKVFSHKYRLKAAYNHVVAKMRKAFPLRQKGDAEHFIFTASRISDVCHKKNMVDHAWSRESNEYLGWTRTAFTEWEGIENVSS